MALNNQQLSQAVAAFAATISKQALGLAHHAPPPGTTQSDCLAATNAFVEQYGGEVRFGWRFELRSLPDHGDYLIAVNYVVWHNPEDGHLVDITPCDEEQGQSRITHNGDLLFLLDDDARPFESGEYVAPLPLRYFAAGDSPELKQHVAELQRKEFEQYNQLYGSSFS